MKTPGPALFHPIALVLVCTAGFALLAQSPRVRAQAIGQVVGVGDLPHGVASVDHAIAFYRDVLGFELVSTHPPMVEGKMTPNVYDARMQAVMDVGGAYYRLARFRVPGASFHLQLVEMINNQRLVGLRGRRQSSATPTERGSLMMRLPVADVDRMLGRIRDGLHGDLLTEGSGAGRAPSDRFAFREGLDGFLIEAVQAPKSPSADTGGAGVVLTAANVDEKLHFYRDLLGFTFEPGDWEPAGPGAGASAGAEMRRTVGRVPGTDVHFEIREYRGFHQRRFYPSTMGQDGVGWIQLEVRDLDELMRVFVAERLLIVSTGLQPVTVDDGTRRVVVRDPDGVFVELIERGGRGGE